MRSIAESNMLLRAPAKSFLGLKLATDEFREGWDFLRARDAMRLKKDVSARGWRLVKGDDGWHRTGVGNTSKDAIQGALKLALRRVTEEFDAVEVVEIDLTPYPWFCVARVKVSPWRIEAGDAPQQTAKSASGQPARWQPRLPSGIPEFAIDMSIVKNNDISAKGEEGDSQ